jgi:hypothetical protein
MEGRVAHTNLRLPARRMLAAAVWLGLACWAIPARGAAADPGMTPAEMQAADRDVLASLPTKVDVTTLGPTHQLIESYFTATSRDDRDKIAKQLAASGIAPEVIGRIAANRQGWSSLRPGVYYIDDKFGAATVRYFLGVPATYNRARNWPVVIKLPTPAAFLTNPWQNGETVAKIYGQWIFDELKAHPDALVLMPLLNLDELWGPGNAGMGYVMEPLNHAASVVNVDPARVYLAGHSMAGHATWNLGVHYPTYFAAINPMAGAMDEVWQTLRLPCLLNTAPVVWADTSDAIVDVGESRKLVNLLKSAKVPVTYHETSNIGHVPPANLLEAMYKEMRAVIRPLYPRTVTIQSDLPETIFNRVDWVQVYDQANAGKITTFKFSHGVGLMMECQNDFRIDAALDAPNHVSVKTHNVAALRLSFNDQMVDFTKPVTVIVDGKSRFSGMLAPNIDEMLKDEMFLGRGWRYFTASVEIDLDFPATPTPRSTGDSSPAGSPPAAVSPKPATRGHIEIISPDGSSKDYTPGQGTPPRTLNEE